ncbi:MAG: glutaredoxin family protein [Thermaceae bacterium]
MAPWYPESGTVRVYGIPGCGPCEIVKIFLSMKGVPFEFVDARKDPEAARKIAELVGTPTAGVEAIRGVNPGRLEAWYQAHVARKG